MDPSQPAIPESLRRALDGGHVVPFVGAGVSMAVMRRGAVGDKKKPLFPSWRALLHAAADRLRREQILEPAALLEALLIQNPVNYYGCAQVAQEHLGDQQWRDLLVEMFDPEFGTAEPSSLKLAEMVWKIESRLVITTNFDRVLQWTCPKSQDLRRIVIEETHALQRVLSAKGGPDRPTVWHLHGHIEEPARMVLAPDGYRLLYGDEKTQQLYTAAFQSLNTIALTKTLLFIGFSLSDRVFMSALAQAHREFQNSGGPHFVMARESERDQFKVLLREHGLANIVQVIGYAEHGEPLMAFLRSLAKEVEVDIAAPDVKQAPEIGRRAPLILGRMSTAYLNHSASTPGVASPTAPVSATPRSPLVAAVGHPQPMTAAENISDYGGDTLVDDLGALLAAHAAGFVRPISRVTGMSEDVVLHHLERAPQKRVQDIFRAVWPSDEALGDFTVAQIRRWQLTGAVARFVGRPYSEVEARLAEEFGQTKVRTVFAERWRREDEAEDTEAREDATATATTEDIESMTIAFVRRRGLAGLISEITGRPVTWVQQRLGEMHGKTYVMRAFRDHWPDDADLGSCTAERCLRLGLAARLARTIDRSPAFVQKRLSAASADTDLRTMFGADWPVG